MYKTSKHLYKPYAQPVQLVFSLPSVGAFMLFEDGERKKLPPHPLTGLHVLIVLGFVA